MSQKEEPKRHFTVRRGCHTEVSFIPLFKTSWRTSFNLPRYEQISGVKSQLYTRFVLWILICTELRSRSGLLTGQPFFMLHFTLEGKWVLLFWELGAPVVREKENIYCIWHKMIKRECLSMNNRLMAANQQSNKRSEKFLSSRLPVLSRSSTSHKLKH